MNFGCCIACEFPWFCVNISTNAYEFYLRVESSVDNVSVLDMDGSCVNGDGWCSLIKFLCSSS